MEPINNSQQPNPTTPARSAIRRVVLRFQRPLILAGVLCVFGFFAVIVYASVQEAPEGQAGENVEANTVVVPIEEQDAQDTNTENVNENSAETASASPASNINAAAVVNTANSNTSAKTTTQTTTNSNASTETQTNTNTARPANTNTVSNAAPVTNERDTQPVEQYTAVVTVQGTGGTTTYNVSVPVGATVSDLMVLARKQGLSYTTKQFGGLGAYVNSINGLSEDTNAGMYWVYRVNNVKATAGISTKTLNRGDSLQWRYEHEQ
jgi:hypothetical protein